MSGVAPSTSTQFQGCTKSGGSGDCLITLKTAGSYYVIVTNKSPNSIIVTSDVARIGASSSRASLIADPNLSAGERTLTRWFNTAAALPPERCIDPDQMFPSKLDEHVEAGDSPASTRTQRLPRPADVGWDAA